MTPVWVTILVGLMALAGGALATALVQRWLRWRGVVGCEVLQGLTLTTGSLIPIPVLTCKVRFYNEKEVTVPLQNVELVLRKENGEEESFPQDDLAVELPGQRKESREKTIRISSSTKGLSLDTLLTQTGKAEMRWTFVGRGNRTQSDSKEIPINRSPGG